MEMTLRWYGSKFDTVTLKQIRQIPGVTGVITTLYDTAPGEVWSRERIKEMKDEVEKSGLHVSGIESVNVHDAIKVGTSDRDKYIDNYIETLENLGKEDIHLVCYNFMPVFDWTRTDLAMDMGDGATCLSYDGAQIEGKSPEDMFREIDNNSNGYAMPGWETERMGEIKELFEKYKNVTSEDLWNNLEYFLNRLMPVCEECDVKMAIHPDDPPWDIFGLPRIIKNAADLERLLSLVDSDINGITFCTGSLGASKDNDLPAMIRKFGDRIYFAHLRNVLRRDGWFNETSHLSSDGSLDMYEIVKALYESGFDGYIRPDHGRMLWGEKARPGYGLYDRALGAAYINGLWEAVSKSEREGR